MTASPISGTCHCGAVRFHIISDLAECTTCDCSLCAMRGAVMVKVPEGSLVVDAGEDALSEYRWNTGVARHYFCKHCGIYVFHRKRAAPDQFGVNLRCLALQNPETIPCRATDGKDMSVLSGKDQPHWPGSRSPTIEP